MVLFNETRKIIKPLIIMLCFMGEYNQKSNLPDFHLWKYYKLFYYRLPGLHY